MSTVDDFSYLWEGSQPDWVLWYLPVVEESEDARNWSIFNRVSKMALIIEDEDLAAQVISELRRRGVEIITEYPA